MAKRADSESKRTTSMDDARLDRVAGLIRQKRTGPEVDEIIAAVKAGLITQQEAIGALERDFEEAAQYRQDRELPIGGFAEDMIVAPDDPEAELLEAESTQELLQVIDQLTDRQAACIKLHFLVGYSQGEIAARLGITKQSVSEHLAAAKKKLAKMLREVPDKVPSRAGTREGQISHPTYEALMTEPEDNDEKRSVPLLFPFELWLRHNEGARWNRYGVYRPIVRNRLPEYLAACFDIPPVVGSWSSPRSGKKSSPADGINMAERLT